MKVGKLFQLGFLCWISSCNANAGLFSFSYTAEGNEFLVTLSGELQKDGDTIAVESVEEFWVDGVARAELAFVGSFSHFLDTYDDQLFYGELGGDPIVSLSGTTMDIFACDTDMPGCEQAFVLFTSYIPSDIDIPAAALAVGIDAQGEPLVESYGNYASANWSRVSSLPSLQLLLIGMLAGSFVSSLKGRHRRRPCILFGTWVQPRACSR